MNVMGLDAVLLTIVHFNSVITGFSFNGDSRNAQKWLDSASFHSLSPNIVSYSAALHSYAREGRSDDSLNAAEQLWKRMLFCKVQPNMVAYSAMIDVCAKTGVPADAVRYFNMMQKAGYVIDYLFS